MNGEVQIESILGDFDEGDRVYFRQTFLPWVFGTVVAVNEDSLSILAGWSDEILVIPEHGSGVNIENSYVGQWRKMPDVSQLKTGDVLSTTLPYYLPKAGGRENFEILEISKDRDRMVLYSSSLGREVILEGPHNFDEILQFWELEG